MRLALLAFVACTGDTEPLVPGTPVEGDTDTDADADADTDSDTDTDTDTSETCSEDLLEPNDTRDEAPVLSAADDLWVRLGAPDLFRVDVPADHRLTVTATHDPLAGDIDLYVLDTDGRTVGLPGTGLSAAETATWCNGGEPVERFVYVEVWAASLIPCNTYDLSFTVVPADCSPADTADTAQADTASGS
jgi:hypothetical protein